MENDWNPYQAPKASLKPDPADKVKDYRWYNVGLVLSTHFGNIIFGPLILCFGVWLLWISLSGYRRPEGLQAANFAAAAFGGLCAVCGFAALWSLFRGLRLAYRTRDRRFKVGVRY